MGDIVYTKSPRLPRKGEKVVKLTCDTDLGVETFHIAWNQVNFKAGKILIPKNIYCSLLIQSLPAIIGPVLHGYFYIINTKYVDEWWMDFEDSDLIFYSPGA